MRIILVTATATLASVILSNSSLAQTPEISVEAMRVTRSTVGQTATGTPGVPIENVSLKYGVSTTGLDLSTQRGKQELQQRVHRAALAACKELGRQFPVSTPSDEDCAKAATDRAMAKVQQPETAGSKK
jgi:UrcA family protein